MSDFDYRTELYRLRLPIYKVASEVEVHPSRLSQYLNGKIPMPVQVKQKLASVISNHREVSSCKRRRDNVPVKWR